MSKEHTPTPWRLVSDNHKEIGQIELGRFQLKSGKRPIVDGYILNEEDAAHIVKCVNMHDELVEVLLHVQKLVAAGCEHGFTDHAWMDELYGSQGKRYAALKKAGAL